MLQFVELAFEDYAQLHSLPTLLDAILLMRNCLASQQVVAESLQLDVVHVHIQDLLKLSHSELSVRQVGLYCSQLVLEFEKVFKMW